MTQKPSTRFQKNNEINSKEKNFQDDFEYNKEIDDIISSFSFDNYEVVKQGGNYYEFYGTANKPFE